MIITLLGHQGIVNGVAISADGHTIFSGSTNNSIKVWRTDGSFVTTLYGYQNTVTSVTVSSDIQTIVSGGKDKIVKVWHFDLDYLLIKGCKRLQEYLDSHPEVDQSQLCPK